MNMHSILAFWSPGPGEMLLILGVALLLYGGKLPEVARSWGQTLAEFRRGLSGIQDEFNQSLYVDTDTERLPYYDEQQYADAGSDEDDSDDDGSNDGLEGSASEGEAADSAADDKPTTPTA
ncbi:MAG: twin-arginine translocase TatA/TatE family subunit [Planctomycetota bacterium]